MRARLKFLLALLFVGGGLWLTLHEPLPGAGIPSLWNCAGSRALVCLQK